MATKANAEYLVKTTNNRVQKLSLSSKFLALGGLMLAIAAGAGAEVKVTGEHNDNTNQTVGDTEKQPDCIETLALNGGLYHITLDTCETPDLRGWAQTTLAPVLREWYPKIVALLPSENFEAPATVEIRLREGMRGVADTSGTRIRCAAKWFRANLTGEAVGSVVHEMVHVVQQYGRVRREHPGAQPVPGWLVEGIADYVRWFLYEPQNHGADMVWIRHLTAAKLHHDSGYRITANFLNWVTLKYDQDLVRQLNAAIREGGYGDDVWKTTTGRTLQELGDEWRSELLPQLAQPETQVQPSHG